MRDFWILTRLMAVNTLRSFSTASGKTGRSGRIRSLAVLVILGLFVAGVVYIEYLAYGFLKEQGQLQFLPGMAIMFATLGTLMLGLFQCMGEMYQAKDAPFLSVLPITSRSLFLARFTALYFMEQMLNVLVMLPALVLYIIGTGRIFPYALTGLLVLLLAPVIPLCISVLLCAGMMRISALAKHRESLLMILSFLLAIAYSLGMTWFNSRNIKSEAMISVVQGANSLTEGFVSVFPPARWCMMALEGEFTGILLVLGVTGGAAALMTLLLARGYLKRILALSETTVEVRNLSERGFRKVWTPVSPFRALCRMEWRQVLRTPAWMYNSLAGLVMFPLLVGIGVYAGFHSSGQTDMRGTLGQFMTQIGPGWTVLMLAAFQSLGMMVNPAPGTSISREGHGYPTSLTFPVPTRLRLLSKAWMGVEINMICGFLMLLVSLLLVGASPLHLLLAFILSQLPGAAMVIFSVAIDLTRPVLNWTNEMQAIKNNVNGILSMPLWGILVGLNGACCYLLRNQTGTVVLLACFGVSILELLLSLLVLGRVARKHSYVPESV